MAKANSKQAASEKKKQATPPGSKTFNQKRKSVEVLSENYSPIKEAKHKDEHSIEDDKGQEDNDDDYSSVDNSESTLKHKYSNATGGLASGQKGRKVVNVEDSIASSSYMMSSAGKDQITAGGKTHIKVGSMSGGKGADVK